ncbi:MAG: hypothetical protein HYS78_01810 [Parcubacteria group bacterium]|nr:hypothetical protein [Parcubacteria group bacterium]
MVTLKLKVAPSVFARLFDELKQTPNQLQVVERTIPEAEFGSYPLQEKSVNFVRILPGERKFDGEQVEMTLELVEEVADADEHQRVKPNKKVTSEMIGELFDLLGIFPRAEKPTEEVERHHYLASQAGIHKP